MQIETGQLTSLRRLAEGQVRSSSTTRLGAAEDDSNELQPPKFLAVDQTGRASSASRGRFTQSGQRSRTRSNGQPADDDHPGNGFDADGFTTRCRSCSTRTRRSRNGAAEERIYRTCCSPPASGASRPRDRAAMEPLAEERSHGSRKTSHLTCGNAACRERLVRGDIRAYLCAVGKMRKDLPTWARALPSMGLAT